jgi:hypothetical protein
MSKFKFKKTSKKLEPTTRISDGVYSAVIIQVADIGLQLPFDKNDAPGPQLAVAFELENGEVVAKRMKFSEHPSSGCYALFTSAFPDLNESDDRELSLSDLLEKPVLIEVEVHEGKWPRVIEILPLEEGFIPLAPASETLFFDAEDMDRDVFLKLQRDIRSWVSKRVRHS